MTVIMDTLSSGANDLSELLHRVFGHREFRAHQREVCEAAASGNDVLLVMPTGAGKSLCYQLPALARGGTALVISPLIALMDDQAAKLSSLGLRVARVHSGLSREDARQACRDYLNGELDFLFIAPERLRVPGFPEMLAKRKPALVAIDEAHCISQWGHDFRPDYRTLGHHLPQLRPAPIVALTATATPTVQQDIQTQLNLQEPSVFITGFRRENLAVEVVEMSKPQRAEFVTRLLNNPAARPAIVYAASRKSAEELATMLNKHFPARAYHAGLEPSVRERVQTDFLSGKLEVVVATVAFGMGVDKADVRTVVHIALPGSVEGYYQEIGRAGRDGKPSRTILLHSYADRKTQDFFLEKSYPATMELQRVARVLTDTFTPIDDLVRSLRIDLETMESVIDKLCSAGVAQTDFNGSVRGTGADAGWEQGYDAQVNVRRAQIDRMVAFAEGTRCRMTALVEHFGDTSDRGRACGMCDICSPEKAIGSNVRQPTADERDALRAILKTLATRAGWSVGKLFAEAGRGYDRKTFDVLLKGLAVAGFLRLENNSFLDKTSGDTITYLQATITAEGRDVDDKGFDTVWLRGVTASASPAKKSRAKAAATTEVNSANWSPEQKRIETELRGWRKSVAAQLHAPAFIVFGDAVLRAIVSALPRNVAELEAVRGMGPEKCAKFGVDVLRICRGEGVAQAAEVREAPAKTKSLNAESAEEKRRERGEVPARREPVEQRVSLAARPAISLAEFSDEQKALEARLREWRMEEALAAGLPSFFILSDTVLRGVVELGPLTIDDLRAIRGMDADKIERFGEAVVALVAGRQVIAN